MLSAAVLALTLAGTLTWTTNIQPVKANPGTVTIRVQYLDGCPRSSAIVKEKYTGWMWVTNESGYVSGTGFQPYTIYVFKAYWPDLGQQFGPEETILTNETGDGSVTIEEDYEITPPAVEILSPQNLSYAVSSVDLSFTIYDYSSIDWMGYSLDGQSNVTVTGNTSLTGLSLGQHNVIVYANDTYGNMGSSNRVYFTRILGCVTIKAQYKDGYPRPNAIVQWKNATEWKYFGTTNESGVKIRFNYLAPGPYWVAAWYPDLATQFGVSKFLVVNETGYGSQTIQANYEITPPVNEVLSPVNMTYTNTSLPLNFTVNDFSPISWIGYSLDNQANVTITGNTTLTNLAIGQHSIIVYANDTYGNMGYSDKIYFTIANDIAISAYASPVPGETYFDDNNCTGGWITVTWLGDLDADFNVDEDDLWMFCEAFIDYYKIHVKDMNCDFDNDCDIDEDDLWTFCAAFIEYWKHQ